MGITLPHEHLLIDFKVMFAEPAAASDKGRAWEPVSLANLGGCASTSTPISTICASPTSRSLPTRSGSSKHAGGSTVVDPTPKTLARDPLALARIARATGMNVIMGSGYYVAASHPPDMDAKSVGALADEMIADVTVGAGDTGVRAGLLGEIGTTYPLAENERKVLRAAVAAQRTDGRSADGAPRAASEDADGAGGARRQGGRRRGAHDHVPHRPHDQRRAGGDRPGADGDLARVRSLRPREFLLPL
jgi:phosphotriesterase-related protein